MLMVMTTNAYDEVFQGDYKSLAITVEDDGSAVDLTNVTTIHWSVAATDAASGVLLQKSYPASGITLTDAANGVIAVVVSGVDTSNLAAGTYFQQLRYDLNAQTKTPRVGTIKIRPLVI